MRDTDKPTFYLVSGDDLAVQVAELSERLHKVELRLFQLEKPKMTNDEALHTFDALKRTDSRLNLVDFAAQYGFSYDALRSARARRRKKVANG